MAAKYGQTTAEMGRQY